MIRTTLSLALAFVLVAPLGAQEADLSADDCPDNATQGAEFIVSGFVAGANMDGATLRVVTRINRPPDERDDFTVLCGDLDWLCRALPPRARVTVRGRVVVEWEQLPHEPFGATLRAQAIEVDDSRPE